MGNIGGGEILVILLVALIVLGPDKLPEVARQVGKVVGEMRKISTGFQREIQEAMRVPDDAQPVASVPPVEPTDAFLPTVPAAISDVELADAAMLGEHETADSPAGANESADVVAPTTAADPIAMTETADPFLTAEPTAPSERGPTDAPPATMSYADVVTPPEAPPLPSDAALGGDR